MLDKITTTREEMFLMLRNQSIRHLGELEAAYIERNGSISIYKSRPDKWVPGLTTLSDDLPDHPPHYRSGTRVPRTWHYSCFKTGETAKLREAEFFPGCIGNEWAESIML